MANRHDLNARREMATLLRQFARGSLTVDKFEEEAELLSDRDSVVYEAYLFVWYHYDDFKTVTMTGDWRLSRESRREWAKWILFLMASDEEYSGPDLTPGCLGFLLTRYAFCLGTLALFRKDLVMYLEVFLGFLWWLPDWVYEQIAYRIAAKEEPLPEYWPFASQESFDRAASLANPFALAA